MRQANKKHTTYGSNLAELIAGLPLKPLNENSRRFQDLTYQTISSYFYAVLVIGL